MKKADLGHWRLGFRGSKATIMETYEYVLSARCCFYHKNYPEFIRDFLETKEFLVIKEDGLVPCRLEDCDDSDQLILRGHSITPCDIERMEDDCLFFNFVDDISPKALLEAAYCTWPLKDYKYREDWLIYFEPGSSDRIWYQISFDLTEENVPCLSGIAQYNPDDELEPWVSEDVMEFEPAIFDMLALAGGEYLGWVDHDQYDKKPIPGQVLTARRTHYNSGKTSATLSKKVTKTGLYQFKNTLTSLTIPEGLTEIDYRAFLGCTSLTEWDIPSPNAKFYSEQGALIEKEHKILVCWPSAEGAVVIPNCVTEIGKGAFFGCTALTSVTIPESVTTIGLSAFEGCTGLTNVSIPKSVTQIKGLAFADCTNLTSVSLAEGLMTIEEHAFSNCTALTGLTLPESTAEIKGYAFSCCEGLTSVTVPKGVKKLWRGIFANCIGLTNAEILMSPAKLPDNLFDGCENLASVTIPVSLLSIGECVFSYCDNLTLYATADSVAEQYAKENNIKFEAI